MHIKNDLQSQEIEMVRKQPGCPGSKGIHRRDGRGAVCVPCSEDAAVQEVQKARKATGRQAR